MERPSNVKEQNSTVGMRNSEQLGNPGYGDGGDMNRETGRECRGVRMVRKPKEKGKRKNGMGIHIKSQKM